MLPSLPPVNLIPTIPFPTFLQAKRKEKICLSIETNVGKWRLFQCKTALISPNFRHVEILWVCSHYSKERNLPDNSSEQRKSSLSWGLSVMHFRMGKRFGTSLSLNKSPFAVGCCRWIPGRQVPALPHQVALPMAAQRWPKGLKGLPNTVLTWDEFPHRNFSASIFKYF